MVDKVFITAVLITFACQESVCQRRAIDSLNNVLENARDDKRFEPLIAKVRSFAAVEYFDSALVVAKEANLLSYRLADSSRIILSSRIIAQLLNRLTRPKEAEEVILKTIGIAKRNNFHEDYKVMLNNLGNSYLYQGFYDKALATNFLLYEIRKKDGNQEDISISLNNIGLVYYKLENFKKALSFYEKCERTKAAANDTYDLDRLYINSGLCYAQMGEHFIAVQLFKNAFSLCTSNCTKAILIEGEFGLGLSYFRLGDYLQAKKHFLKSLSIARAAGNTRFMAENYVYLGEICTMFHDRIAALLYLDKCNVFCVKYNYNEIRLQVYKALVKLWSESSTDLMVTNYQQKFIQLDDSIHGIYLTQNLMAAQAEYEQIENNKKIQTHAEMLRLKEDMIARQKTINFLSGILVCLLSVVIALLYRRNRYNKLSQESLERQVNDRTQTLLQKYESMQRSVNAKTSLCRRTKNEIKAKIVTLSGLFSIVESRQRAESSIQVPLNSLLTDLAKSVERIDAGFTQN